MDVPPWRSFFQEVITEAKGPAGTWSFATYSKLRDVLSDFSDDSTRFFLTGIFNELCSVDNGSCTKYKLAQICATIHAMHFSQFDREFPRMQTRLKLCCQTLPPDELRSVTIAILEGLFRKPTSPRMPEVRKGGQRYRTPSPRWYALP
jgi:hypothetical protein